MQVGDYLKWSWKGNHGVWRIPGPDCPEVPHPAAPACRLCACPCSAAPHPARHATQAEPAALRCSPKKRLRRPGMRQWMATKRLHLPATAAAPNTSSPRQEPTGECRFERGLLLAAAPHSPLARATVGSKCVPLAPSPPRAACRFASPAPGDCEDGMLAKWVVTA